jgi:putative phosphoesterase
VIDVRIGVISDTHNNLPNVGRIVAILNAARVERVVHTGDVTQAKTLRVLAALRVPLVGVYGNNDEREPLAEAAAEAGFEMVEPPLELAWSGRRILVVHDPLDVERWWSGHDVVLHGHDHRRRIERDGDRLVFNPGECAGHLEGHNAVGIVDLGSLATEIVLF